MYLKDCKLEIIDGSKIFKSKILLEIYDEKKFYQRLQVPKNNRIKINNIYFVFERNFVTNENKIINFTINKSLSDSSSNTGIDLTELINPDQINNLKNWIELKKYSSQLLLEAKKLK